MITNTLHFVANPRQHRRHSAAVFPVVTGGPEFISADGIKVSEEHREKAVTDALKAAADLHAA